MRLALVFVATVLVWRLVEGGLSSFFGPGYSDRVGHAVRAMLTSALVVPLIFVARRHLDRRRWSGLRLTSLRAGWRPLLFGGTFWLVSAGIGLAVTFALGWATVSVGTPSTEFVLLALYLPLLVFLYEALPEELIFRGYFYRNLATRYPRGLAVAMQAALFTLFGTVIGAADSVDQVILFFTFSVLQGILRVVTGNLWAPIGFHLVFQWVAQLNTAAVREGLVRIGAQPTLELVAFWFFPIILGSVALFAWSVVRGCPGWRGWRERDPEPLRAEASRGVANA